MDGREGMPSFYFNRGVSGPGSHSGSGSQGGGLNVPPPGFNNQSNPTISPLGHSNMRVGSMGPPNQVEHNPSSNFPHGINMGGGSGVGGDSVSVAGGSGGVGDAGRGDSVVPITNPRSGDDSVVTKKRGRPRKYGPDGSSQMALAVPPASPVAVASGSAAPIPRTRGRPPGSGRKQRLADVGEWMNASAGSAFTPYVIDVETGEDVAEKVMSFAQHKSRALCILTGSGPVSAMTLRQATSSGSTATYEGCFEILGLSGSYMFTETGSLKNGIGGLTVSVTSADGHVIGGAVVGRLIASGPVQVVASTFVVGGDNSNTKSKKIKADEPSRDEKSPVVEPNETSPAPSQHPEIDLTHG